MWYRLTRQKPWLSLQGVPIILQPRKMGICCYLVFVFSEARCRSHQIRRWHRKCYFLALLLPEFFLLRGDRDIVVISLPARQIWMRHEKRDFFFVFKNSKEECVKISEINRPKNEEKIGVISICECPKSDCDKTMTWVNEWLIAEKLGKKEQKKVYEKLNILRTPVETTC